MVLPTISNLTVQQPVLDSRTKKGKKTTTTTKQTQ